MKHFLTSEVPELGNRVMTGDRPEDEGAAVNAGIRFMWAGDWRNGDLV